MSHSSEPTDEGPVIASGVITAPSSKQIDEITSTQETKCCVVGGGPAGVMLSYLLARQGVTVILLEAHKDFDRKFRGDTIHPSILEVMAELGLAERLHQLRHTKSYGPTIQTAKGPVRPIDFRRLKTEFPYIMLVPQVDFLNFMVEEAKQYPHFQVRMGALVHDLIEVDGVVKGVRYRDENGVHEVRAAVTIGTDGRHSRIRHLSGFEPIKTSPPMDVLWFNLPLLPEGPPVQGLFARFGVGRTLILFERVDHLQAGYIFTKGHYQELKAAGLDSLKRSIVEIEPRLENHLNSLKSWRDVTLLSVESSRCPRWYKDGLLLIGDAAHVMSPVGGVGINYAIHDAIEAANVLTEPLKLERLETRHLRQVQRRRQWPTQFIQGVQAFAQKQLAARVLNSSGPPKLPLLVRWLLKVPLVRDIPARLIAFGIGRSHIKL